MLLRHKGIRPKHTLITVYENSPYRKNFVKEKLPNGCYRLWSDKTLTSGCGSVFEEETSLGLDGLIYCPYCDEYFSTDQFEEMSGE